MVKASFGETITITIGVKLMINGEARNTPIDRANEFWRAFLQIRDKYSKLKSIKEHNKRGR